MTLVAVALVVGRPIGPLSFSWWILLRFDTIVLCIFIVVVVIVVVVVILIVPFCVIITTSILCRCVSRHNQWPIVLGMWTRME